MNLVIVTSVIDTIQKPLSYTNTRSVFTIEERFKQTIKTIESIKKYINNPYIVLIEGSHINNDYEYIFKNIVDYYFNISDIKIYKDNIDSPYKICGEASLLLSYLDSEHLKNNILNFKSITKISGRYYLTEECINIDEYLKYSNILCKYYKEHNNMSTIIYSFSINELNDYYISIKYIYNNLEKYKNESIENILYDIWLKNKNYNNIEKLGVCGNIAVNNYFISV